MEDPQKETSVRYFLKTYCSQGIWHWKVKSLLQWK